MFVSCTSKKRNLVVPRHQLFHAVLKCPRPGCPGDHRNLPFSHTDKQLLGIRFKLFFFLGNPCGISPNGDTTLLFYMKSENHHVVIHRIPVFHLSGILPAVIIIHIKRKISVDPILIQRKFSLPYRYIPDGSISPHHFSTKMKLLCQPVICNPAGNVLLRSIIIILLYVCGKNDTRLQYFHIKLGSLDGRFIFIQRDTVTHTDVISFV